MKDLSEPFDIILFILLFTFIGVPIAFIAFIFFVVFVLFPFYLIVN